MPFLTTQLLLFELINLCTLFRLIFFVDDTSLIIPELISCRLECVFFYQTAFLFIFRRRHVFLVTVRLIKKLGPKFLFLFQCKLCKDFVWFLFIFLSLTLVNVSFCFPMLIFFSSFQSQSTKSKQARRLSPWPSFTSIKKRG